MDKKLQQLFDLQKFVRDDELQAVIEQCETPSSAEEAQGTPQAAEVGKNSVWRNCKRSLFTMAGSAAAAGLVLVLNLTLVREGGTGQPGGYVGSLFAGKSAGWIAAGLILLLGTAVSVALYVKDRRNRPKK